MLQPVLWVIGQVQLPVGRRAVAGLFALPHEIVHPRLGRAGQPVIAMIMAVLAGQNADAAWGADGVLGVRVGELDPRLGEAIEMGGEHLRVTEAGKLRGVVLVSEDHQNVVTWHGLSKFKIVNTLPLKHSSTVVKPALFFGPGLT